MNMLDKMSSAVMINAAWFSVTSICDLNSRSADAAEIVDPENLQLRFEEREYHLRLRVTSYPRWAYLK
jgi:hypothetical protein